MRNFNKPKSVYETLNPTSRFVAMAKSILDQFGEDIGDGMRIFSWPHDATGPHYALHHRTIKSTTEYTLEHHGETGAMPVRYRVRNGVKIRLLDEKNSAVKLDPESEREVNRQALTILTEAIGSDAQELVDQAININFKDIVGKLVISHLAVPNEEGNVGLVNEDTGANAGLTYVSELLDVYEEIAEASEEPGSDMDPARVRLAIEAFNGMSPLPRNKQINLVNEAKAAARKIGPSWTNTIQAAHNS